MLGLFYCRKTNLVSPYVGNAGESQGCLRVLLCSFMVSGSKRFSSVEAVEGRDELKRERGKNSFAIGYLMKSCGLSRESAKSVTRYIQFNSAEKPHSVLELLKKHGFMGHQVTRIVKSCPRILIISGDTVLLPKLEFISSIGFSGAERTKLIASCPRILAASLQNKLIPSHNDLKSMMARDEIVQRLKRAPWLLLLDVQKYVASKGSILSSYGVPGGHVKMLIKLAPRLVCSAGSKFEEIVKRVIGLGFDPTKRNFICAVAVIYSLQQSTWEQKVKAYKSLGWSEDDFLLAFRTCPHLMAYSEKKIRSVMDFYVNKMDLQPSLVAKTPYIVGFSLEKRIKPRWSVITVLMSKGVLKNGNFSYAYILSIGDKEFMDRFMIKYCKDVPELLSVFKGKSVSQSSGSSYQLAS